MKTPALTFALIAGLASLNVSAHGDHQDKHALLADWMVGHFDSERQSVDDKDFFNIHLNMKRIWLDDKDSWIYVEQAASTHLEKPYRQRVYQITALSDTEFASKVYTFENALSFAGDYQKLRPLASLSPTDLKEKQGCTVFLTWSESEQNFSGSTDEKSCLSSLRGATYATSEVTVTADKIVSWDRGWSQEDKQVWGAVKAGYEFLKR